MSDEMLQHPAFSRRRAAGGAVSSTPGASRPAGLLSCAIFAVTLAGCASQAGIEPASSQLSGTQLGLRSSQSGPVDAGTPIGQAWWRQFNDAALDRLVEQALAESPALKIARARIERARAGVGGAVATDGLQLAGTTSATRQRFSANSIYPAPLGGSTRTLGNAQLDASYDFDFFGRNRAAIAAAVGAERATQADAEAARILLATRVARTYVQLGRLLEQREVAWRTLDQRTEILKLIRQRVRAGLDTKVELRQGEGALPETRQQIEQLNEQIALTRHALAALTAQAPDALEALNVKLQSISAIDVPASLSTDLLGRRADVVAARWRVEAASGGVAIARAGFYPNFRLTGFFGLSSIGLNQLLEAGSRQYAVGPALTLPIFDNGALRANLRGKVADYDAAVESYNGAVLDAVHQAADQITSLRAVALQQAEQSEAQKSAEAAFSLAKQRFKAGLATYLTVLNAEASVLNQRRLAVDLKARALDTQIVLIHALGGGFDKDTLNPSEQRAAHGESE